MECFQTFTSEFTSCRLCVLIATFDNAVEVSFCSELVMFYQNGHLNVSNVFSIILEMIIWLYFLNLLKKGILSSDFLLVNNFSILWINATSCGAGFCLQVFYLSLYRDSFYINVHKQDLLLATSLIFVFFFFPGKNLAGFDIMKILPPKISCNRFPSFSLPRTMCMKYNYLPSPIVWISNPHS